MTELTTKDDAVIKQKERTKKLFNQCIEDEHIISHVETGDCEETEYTFNYDSVKNLCQKHSELIDDFEFVKDMNRIITERFDKIIERLPTPEELDLILVNLHTLYTDEIPVLQSRTEILHKLRSTCVAVYRENNKIRPSSYEESVEVKK